MEVGEKGVECLGGREAEGRESGKPSCFRCWRTRKGLSLQRWRWHQQKSCPGVDWKMMMEWKRMDWL